MSSDPAMADGLNWYRYAGNNPIIYSDPTGLYMWPGYGYGKAPPGHKKDEGSRNKESESNDNSNGESDSESSEEDNSSSESNNTSESYDPATRENGDGTGSPAWQNPDGSELNKIPFSITGKRLLTANELWFAYEVLGQDGMNAGRTAIVYPWIKDWGFSPPAGNGITLSNDGISREYLGSNSDANLLIHELFHKVQYATMKGSRWDISFNRKVHGNYELGKKAHILNNSDIQTISDIVSLEGQAEMVGNYADYYYTIATGGKLYGTDLDYFKRMHTIMGNSGYANTYAYQYIKRKNGW